MVVKILSPRAEQINNGEKTMEETIVKNVTEKPNSFEVGKAGRRFKLYFADKADLMAQLKGFVDEGILSEEDFKNA